MNPEEKAKPILLTISANFVLKIPEIQKEQLISRKDEIHENAKEWIRREAAIKGWNIKKLWHYYKMEYRSYTSISAGAITTYIEPYLKGRGGRKPKKKNDKNK